MVAWANCWDWMSHWKDWGPTYRDGWNGSFNIPREVRLLPDNTLQFLPIRELQNIRNSETHAEDILLMDEEKYSVAAGDGVAYELKVQIDLEKTDAEALEICLRCDDSHKTVCRLDFAKAQMTVDRTNADNWSRGTTRSVLFLRDSKTLDVHIFSDQSSVEIFAQNYCNNHALNVFAGNDQNGIYFKSYGGKVVISSMESYGLNRTIR
jgi:beta-fructofuranosidase